MKTYHISTVIDSHARPEGRVIFEHDGRLTKPDSDSRVAPFIRRLFGLTGLDRAVCHAGAKRSSGLETQVDLWPRDSVVSRATVFAPYDLVLDVKRMSESVCPPKEICQFEGSTVFNYEFLSVKFPSVITLERAAWRDAHHACLAKVDFGRMAPSYARCDIRGEGASAVIAVHNAVDSATDIRRGAHIDYLFTLVGVKLFCADENRDSSGIDEEVRVVYDPCADDGRQELHVFPVRGRLWASPGYPPLVKLRDPVRMTLPYARICWYPKPIDGTFCEKYGDRIRLE